MLTTLLFAAAATQAPHAVADLPANAGASNSDSGVRSAESAPDPGPSTYLVRLGVDIGGAAPSAERDVLAVDGYHTGRRTWFLLDASLLATPHLGFGAWGSSWYAGTGSVPARAA